MRTTFYLEIVKGRDHLEYLDVEGVDKVKMVLKSTGCD
jgi:hypothetical protein